QVDFKSKAKAFTRSYGFLASILPYTSAEWEKLSIFLNFLVPRLPAPAEEDLAKGILEAIDMDSYRVEKQAAVKIQLPDAGPEPRRERRTRGEPATGSGKAGRRKSLIAATRWQSGMTLRGGSLRREPGTHRLDRTPRPLDRYSKTRAKRTSASALFRAGVAEVRNARKASYLR